MKNAEELIDQLNGLNVEALNDLEGFEGLAEFRQKQIKLVEQYATIREKEHANFQMPTDQQLIEIAILFNDGELDDAKLADMVAMCQFILDRLIENGNISKPSSKESHTKHHENKNCK